ncbi:peptidase U32 family protein [Flammeovirgaceae bacterium SG7u.111]|nr:peptidase U32 family protein [Flammeovirgaceae bacterium SG7u.132]WPO33358.1 peptidase U32 family protein [Flammeovirgaceae bacterium SG7u.111]
MERKKPVLLAPVGSFESLMAAVQGGADAVYFGIEQLNMRARSSFNFTLEDIGKVAQICKENGLRSYITLNTVLYDYDIRLMKTIVDAAKAKGIDAVIAMDHAVINYTKEIGMPLHLSTQLNITNVETLKFYANFAEVAVLSRELTLQQVEKICKEVETQQIKGPSGKLMKIETFVHGALCMAVSGKCYLSLHSMNSSANRGACKQNCRRPYTITDDEGNSFKVDNEYIMSPKDLCTIGFLDKILDAGVAVLKIEGRSKGPEYVKEVTECYREAIDTWMRGEEFDLAQVAAWEERLENVYNRGFWGGYYLGKELGEWTDKDGSAAKQEKLYLGKAQNFFSKIKIGEFKIETGELSVGDEVMITGPTLGVHRMKVENLRYELKDVEKVEKGQVFSMPVDIKLRPSDKLFKLVVREKLMVRKRKEVAND